MTDLRDLSKAQAGRRAAELVESGMCLGLGTGSTVYFTIVAIAEAGMDVVCVATSKHTEMLAHSLGLPLVSPDEVVGIDLAIDGADEVDESLNLVKGAGGALTREKIVAAMASRFVVVVDESKLVHQLGAFPLPLESISFAPSFIMRRVRALGAVEVTRRLDSSDNGNLLLDARFEQIPEPARLAADLSAIPGLVEHGLFLSDMVERVIVGSAGGVRELVRAGAP